VREAHEGVRVFKGKGIAKGVTKERKSRYTDFAN